MRKALIDAEMELQQGAVATQDRHKTLQARFMLAPRTHPGRAPFPVYQLFIAWLSRLVAAKECLKSARKPYDKMLKD